LRERQEALANGGSGKRTEVPKEDPK